MKNKMQDSTHDNTRTMV